MFVIPGWIVMIIWIIPVFTIMMLFFVLIASLIHSAYVMYRTNKYVNNFGEWTQVYNCHVMVALLISFFGTTAGLLAGVPVGHPALGLWYCITLVMCFLYWVFVIDYYILKYKGMIG